MKGRLWIGLLALGALIVVGLVLRERQGRSGLVEIERRGTLRVGLDASFPPFESLAESGQVVGLDVDIARAIAAEIGVEVDYANIGFDGLYDALETGRIDVIISGLPVDPYRTREVAYSSSYFNAGQVLVTRDPAVQSVADLAGRAVAVEWGSMADMEARRLRQTQPALNLEIDPRPDPQAALQAAVAIVDGVTALSHPELRRVTYLSDEWYAVAVRREDQALLAIINDTLARLQETGELDRLQGKWF